MRFESIHLQNFPEVQRIYEEGLATGVATFETHIPEWDKWDSDHLAYGRILATDGKSYLGWASLAPVSGRCVYGGVAEVSVYVSEKARGQGVGYYLLGELIRISEENGIWTLQSGIMPGNIASINLHKKCGFRTIGYREKVAQLNGVWMDNILMERRSKVVGV
ncbi:GNAT family N-acetyltransferase [Portibacter marinus]|uniref:GNAT family N-acetyltransferase n=1 Tax=Portibacter marinus TaxID=2898660 RepID=UPI001F164EBB|nr:GNAT family N-acetyltransferase [Portibacter marinus]